MQKYAKKIIEKILFISKNLLGKETKEEEEKRQKKGGGAYQGRGAYQGQYGN